MEPEAWPTPQTPAREPLPRVEDLPVAEQGYEQESVKAAFDSFYRHAAQVDAALRTLEAVDSFHRQRRFRCAPTCARCARPGWTQQSWTQPQSYGYGMRAPREGVPPAVWRIGGEVAFLVAVAVAFGVAQALVVGDRASRMAGAFAIVCLIEWLCRARADVVRPAWPARRSPPSILSWRPQRAEDTDEHDSLGWTAFEEAQEPSDAMTIIGDAVTGRRSRRRVVPEPGPEPNRSLSPSRSCRLPRSRTTRAAVRAGGGAGATTNEPGPRARTCRGTFGCFPPMNRCRPMDPWEAGLRRAARGRADEEDPSEAVLVEDASSARSAPADRLQRDPFVQGSFLPIGLQCGNVPIGQILVEKNEISEAELAAAHSPNRSGPAFAWVRS